MRADWGKSVRLGVVAIAFAYLCAAVVIAVYGLKDKPMDADLIVVPGNTIEPPGVPSPRLKARLDAALDLFQMHKAPAIFVSGGTGKEGYDEAVVMAQYLTGKGVPAQAIIIDSEGFNTAATARHAARYMKAHRLRIVLAVSQYFHVPRTVLALKAFGICRVGSVHADYTELRDIYSLAREVLAYVVYYVRYSGQKSCISKA